MKAEFNGTIANSRLQMEVRIVLQSAVATRKGQTSGAEQFAAEVEDLERVQSTRTTFK